MLIYLSVVIDVLLSQENGSKCQAIPGKGREFESETWVATLKDS